MKQGGSYIKDTKGNIELLERGGSADENTPPVKTDLKVVQTGKKDTNKTGSGTEHNNQESTS